MTLTQLPVISSVCASTPLCETHLCTRCCGNSRARLITTMDSTHSCLQAALERLTPEMGWLVLDPHNRQDVVPCARRRTTDRNYDVALIAPEHMRELELHLLTDDHWSASGDGDGYSGSLPCHPDTLKAMGIYLPIHPRLTLPGAVRLMAAWQRSSCRVCKNRFAGAKLCEEGLCLMCYTMFGEVSPEDPCVVCQVEDKRIMHRRLVVECKQCKKHTCLECCEKLTRLDCPACRSPLELCHATRSNVKLCCYPCSK